MPSSRPPPWSAVQGGACGYGGKNFDPAPPVIPAEAEAESRDLGALHSGGIVTVDGEDYPARALNLTGGSFVPREVAERCREVLKNFESGKLEWSAKVSAQTIETEPSAQGVDDRAAKKKVVSGTNKDVVFRMILDLYNSGDIRPQLLAQQALNGLCAVMVFALDGDVIEAKRIIEDHMDGCLAHHTKAFHDQEGGKFDG